MKKVLFFIESLGGGGAEKVLSDLVKHLDPAKYDITVGTVVDGGIYTEAVSSYCKVAPILERPTEGDSYLRKFWYKVKYKLIYRLPVSWVYKFTVKDTYDVEIGFVEGFATKFVSRSANPRSRKIAWLHCDPINHSYADSYYSDLDDQINSYKTFDHIVCVSHNVKDAFEKRMFKSRKVTVCYNPIDSASVVNRSLESGEFRLNTRGSKMLLCSIGRLVPEKGYVQLLEAVRELKNDGLQLELWIIGEGEERGKLEEFIAQHDLEDTVTLMGFDLNPYRLLKMCDVYVCSSKAEGFSMAVAEAMVLGLPVVSTNCAGPSELLGDGEYGYLVDNNSRSLYEGIKTLITNEEVRHRFKRKSLERRNIFNMARSIQQIENLFS
ncbi:glycosyltransferase [Paenibacillus antri]|uniref:Glycosyltransferase n=1 Tax=Paenibacillus antri TaxID=2582848 RepID=A0A5R9G4Z4_9BACL|nr:glycosyltransferase [Paenibacillus antri]TLS49406.1 glycosyltransferase [Paenibacillus antri]